MLIWMFYLEDCGTSIYIHTCVLEVSWFAYINIYIYMCIWETLITIQQSLHMCVCQNELVHTLLLLSLFWTAPLDCDIGGSFNFSGSFLSFPTSFGLPFLSIYKTHQFFLSFLFLMSMFFSVYIKLHNWYDTED